MTRARDLADNSGGLFLLGTKAILSAGADTTSLQLNNVFSANFQNYRIDFDLIAAADSGRSTTSGFFMGFGNSGTIRTSGDVWEGTIQYAQSSAGSNDSSFSSKATDSCGIMGTFTTQGAYITGHSIVRNPFDSTQPHEVKTEGCMHYPSEATGQYPENSVNVTTDANFSTTDVNFQAVTGINTDNTVNDVSALTKINMYGIFKVYGIKGSFNAN